MSEIAAACRFFEEDLSALLDGELDAARSAELRAHLATCPACTRRMSAFDSADTALRSVAEAPGIDAARVERLRQATAARVRNEAAAPAEPRARAAAPRRRRSATLLAVASLAAGIAALVLFEQHPDSTQRSAAVAKQSPAAAPGAASDAIAAAAQRIAAKPPSDAFAASGASAPPDIASPIAPPSLDSASDEELELATALVPIERGQPNEAEPASAIRERIARLPDDERNALVAQLQRLRAMSADERTVLRERVRRYPDGRAE